MGETRAPHGWSQIAAFYSFDSVPERVWAARMVLVAAPPGKQFSYNDHHARGLRVHPKVADRLAELLAQVATAGLWEYVERIGGGYAMRAQRSSRKLSMHALGGAVDFDPLRNPLGAPLAETALGTEPGLGVVRLFEAAGWTWGGRWARPDAMHFQFGGGY